MRPYKPAEHYRADFQKVNRRFMRNISLASAAIFLIVLRACS